VVAGAATKALNGSGRAAQLARNALQGKKGEAITRAKLGDKVAGEKVTFVRRIALVER
jgi:hypothetical protein